MACVHQCAATDAYYSFWMAAFDLLSARICCQVVDVNPAEDMIVSFSTV
jgi:hypothetical protein